MAFDKTAVARALEAKAVRVECYACGRNDWAFADAETLLPTFDPEGRTVDPGSGVPAFVMVCNHCGFVRMHATSALMP